MSNPADNVKFPTNAQVRETLTDEELAQMIKDLPSYNRSPITLASLEAEELTAEIILAWSGLVRAMVQLYPSVKVTANKITRDRTPEEIEEAVLSNEASKRYYAAREAATKAAK